MNEDQLITLFKKHGYTCVATLSSYHALKLEDIEERKVKEGACTVLAVSNHCHTDFSIPEIENFILRIQASKLTDKPFDTSQPYEVLPREKPPEWRGWDIEDLRKMFGWDQEFQEVGSMSEEEHQDNKTSWPSNNEKVEAMQSVIEGLLEKENTHMSEIVISFTFNEPIKQGLAVPLQWENYALSALIRDHSLTGAGRTALEIWIGEERYAIKDIEIDLHTSYWLRLRASPDPLMPAYPSPKVWLWRVGEEEPTERTLP